ncbi:hypothetical protein AX17_004627 [Amanita inopinata Kibby_2008]|nr:hypothetical protein AX17_004627 [Amanita inopinata Kibby_2008]
MLYSQRQVILLIYYLAFWIGTAWTAPLLTRQNASSQTKTVTTVHVINTATGPMTETCTITFTPITDSAGTPAVKEVKSCTLAPGAPSGSTAPTTTSKSPSASVSLTTSVIASPSQSIIVHNTTSAPIPATTASAPVPGTGSGVSPSATPTTPAIVTSGSTSATSSQASAAAAEQASATPAQKFEIPGKNLSVLPIGLGVFAGISVIALIVVGLVTYERTKYRKAFRQRRLAEMGSTMGYGGMALTISFLVDNCIEWMTKLPPGFTHELHQHLQQGLPPGDGTLGVPVLDFDKFCCGKSPHHSSCGPPLIVCRSAWILSPHIGDEEPRFTLFDTGPDSLSLARNIASLQVPIHNIQRVVISHWHADHTGGLLSFLRLRSNQQQKQQAQAGTTHANSTTPCIVDVHPDRPVARGIAPGPTFDKVICALPYDPSFTQIEDTGGVVEEHSHGHAVANGSVWVSGEIPRVTEWEQGIAGGMRWFERPDGAKGEWVAEQHIMDERYAAIDVAGKGLVLFSACSHAGIVNVVKDAIATFSRPIYMIVGGLHLAGLEFKPRLQPTVDFLSKQLRPAPTYVLPMHCSGFQTKLALEAALGEGCVPAGVGHRVDIIGNRNHESQLFPPVY